jgi:hypothetical protein
MSKKPKLPTDVNKKGKAILDLITGETPITEDGKNALL